MVICELAAQLTDASWLATTPCAEWRAVDLGWIPMTYDVKLVRAAYPALSDGCAYLDGAAGTQVPATVIEAIVDAYRSGIGNVGGTFPASGRSGSIVADMSSISPLVAQKAAAACAAKGVRFLDAPVSGGEPKAIDGTLAIMVGGDEGTFQEMLPVFQKLGSSVTLTGAVGAGNVTKLANQIIVACNIAAMGEALVLATRAGLDPEVVFNAIKGGLAGSTVLNAKAPMVIGRNFKPGFRIKLHQKDLRNALLAAESMKVALPLTSSVQQMLMALMNEGKGDLDHSAIVTFIEQMAGTEVKRAQSAGA